MCSRISLSVLPSAPRVPVRGDLFDTKSHETLRVSLHVQASRRVCCFSSSRKSRMCPPREPEHAPSIDEKVASLVDLLVQAETKNSSFLERRESQRDEARRRSSRQNTRYIQEEAPPPPAQHRRSGQSSQGLKEAILSLRSEIHRKDHQIHDLTERLVEARSELELLRESSAKTTSDAIAAAKQRYEESARKQLEFMDTLLEDKRQLTAKTEGLAEQLQRAVREHNTELEKTSKDFHARLEREREQWHAAERVRRQKWAQQTREDLKRKTMASLEPKVQELMTQHRLTEQQLREQFEADLLRARSEARRKADEEIRQIRSETQAQLVQQAESMRLQFQNSLDNARSSSEAAHEELRRELASKEKRLREDAEAERNKLIREAQERESRVRAECEHNYRLEITRLEAEARRAREELDAERRQSQAREDESLSALRRTFTVVMDEHKRRCEVQARRLWEAKGTSLAEKLRAEQEKLIANCAAEIEERGRAEQQKHAADAQLREKSLRDSWEDERKKWLDTENTLRKELATLNSDSLAREVKLQARVEELEASLRRARARADKGRTETLQENARRERKRRALAEREKLAAHDRAAHVRRFISAKRALAAAEHNCRRAAEEEKTALMKSHGAELDALAARVRALVSQKDEVIERLQADLAAANEEIEEFKGMLL
eukprot:gnl/Chilomastix_cuspidata/2557.p2 GENE.gnl/Chilomastix_cuspidata/2557~~gnl/Chilomastix_cuspidata/2557.p2  ORF type:complete len:669 (+),score=249.51 gnl/Chilomastix_cuspidata/2557:387-2393(+)